jgi:3-oxoacyl-[acyl-carrier protein] reductase
MPAQTHERRLAIVTGGGRGIGRAICLALAEDGYRLVINYRSNRAAAEQTLAAVEAAGSEGLLLELDVTDTAACTERLPALLQAEGAPAVLVNNAGVTADGLFPMMSAEAWQSVVRTSLDGFFNLTKPVVKAMMRKRSGSIVTISSVSGLVANRGQVNYSAAKAGLIGATRSLAAEVARLGIRVNAVAPGLIETDMTAEVARAMGPEMIKQLIPMNRFGTPAEVAQVVRFLCSDQAAYVTGQVIGVNGGMV